jgi:hypothetical protein
MKLTLSLTPLLLAIAACGGGSGGGATNLCDALCDRELMCDPMSTTCDRAECDAFEDKVRTEAAVAITSCFETLACGDSDDQCLVEGIEAVSSRAIDDEFASGCNAAVDTCQISDDLCSSSVLFEDQFVEAGIECLDLPCDELELCFADAFGI